MTLTKEELKKCINDMLDLDFEKNLDDPPKRVDLFILSWKILTIVQLNIDMSLRIEEFEDKFGNCQDFMGNTDMSLFIQEMDHVLFELDLTEERVHEMLILMDNLRELCKRYDYDLTSHKFDETYDKLESIMSSKGFVI